MLELPQIKPARALLGWRRRRSAERCVPIVEQGPGNFLVTANDGVLAAALENAQSPLNRVSEVAAVRRGRAAFADGLPGHRRSRQ